MQYKMVTPVTTEPLSLAEVKLHLHLASDTLSGDIVTQQSIVPGSHGISASITGTAIDVSGKTAVVNLNSGTCTGSLVAKIQDSDDNSTWVDFHTFTTVTAANDNAIQEKEYTGAKQYIRVVAAVTSAACVFGADVILKTGDSVEDSLLTALITAAREYCEGFTGRALATQTIEAYPEYFFGDMELPRPPLQSVASVKYKDSEGAETTLTEDTDYIVDTDSVFGRLALPYSKSWPTFTAYPVNPIRVRYDAGYSDADSVPQTIKLAMLLLVGHWYKNREAAGKVEGQIEFAVKALLTLHKVRWF